MGRTVRRFSQGSHIVASYIQDLVAKDECEDHLRGLSYLQTLSQHSLSVPHRHLLGGPLRDPLEEDPFLTDRRMRSALEEASLINWCPTFKRLIPLAVTNDGNTLCHSASLAMWGIHDRKVQLRHLLGQALKSSIQQELKQRWKKQLLVSKTVQQGNQNWEEEWQVLLELTSETNKSARSDNPIYEPMEEFHIFVLANVLRRPIIVFADRPICSADTEEVTSSFSGLYLPLLWPNDQCCKSPLVMGYCDNYFSPLIIFGSTLEDTRETEPCPFVIPLVGMDKIPVEFRYLTAEEEASKYKLLHDYMLIAEMDVTVSPRISHVLTVAKLILNPMDESQKLIHEFFNLRDSEVGAKSIPPPVRRVSKFRCGNKTCSEFIDQDHLFPYCSGCYPKFSSSIPKDAPTRRKINNPVVRPTSLEVDCAVAGCPYFAAVNCFPYCQQCHTLRSSHNPVEAISSASEASLEDRWKKLAMGVLDEQIIPGTQQNSNLENEVIFRNLHHQMLLEDGEKCGMGEATSTRSHVAEASTQHKISVTGGRSQNQRKISKEELVQATNAMNLEGSDDWKRKISWINEPCIQTGCSYFASARTYPYCNQCAAEKASAGSVQRIRKVSGTCTLIQED